MLLKKILPAAFLSIVIASCGGTGSQGKLVSENGNEMENGQALVSKSACLTCHKTNAKLIGPSYEDVAAKYAGMPDTIVAHLAGKIIAGGSGVWGQVPMTPHPDISKSDAELMVKYILSLKK